MYCTYGWRQRKIHQNLYSRHVNGCEVNRPTKNNKFHADCKNNLEQFHTISEGHNFLKLYEKSGPKFKQVVKKVPTSRTGTT